MPPGPDNRPVPRLVTFDVSKIKVTNVIAASLDFVEQLLAVPAVHRLLIPHDYPDIEVDVKKPDKSKLVDVVKHLRELTIEVHVGVTEKVRSRSPLLASFLKPPKPPI